MSFDRIIDWSMTKIEIPFRTPFTIVSGTSKLKLHTRTILLLKVRLSSGQELLSEAHPLPGLHPETIDFCQQELETFLHTVRHVPFTLPPTQLDFFKLEKLSGPSRVAIEGLFLPRLLPYPHQVISQLLIVPDLQPPVANQFKGYKYLKIKLGRLDFKQELAWAQALHEALAPDVRWRLDGNQQLSADQLAQLAAMPFATRIDYIEEPLVDFYKILCAPTQDVLPLPFALDESLPLALASNLDLIRLKRLGLKAFIIRPPSLGGYTGAMKVMELADSFNLFSVLSSCFEGPWGFERLLHLLSAPVESLSRAEAHGLDTVCNLDFEHLHVRIPNIPLFNPRSSK
ncbi:MAG: hypothetical protein A2X86_13585 [Bdellovibrionales bacterium GWA2_49_15]|nr:MAG: hypothetical protein A2X86_13585 [Bdellovibrionales bacterium GWA2_49_15]